MFAIYVHLHLDMFKCLTLDISGLFVTFYAICLSKEEGCHKRVLLERGSESNLEQILQLAGCLK